MKDSGITSPPRRHRALLALLFALPVGAMAQTPPAPPAAPAGALPLEAFAWLVGCWEGKVNERDFREEWLPLRGEVMVGASQTAMRGKTLSYEFLRLEPRADAIYYIALPSGRQESPFKMTGRNTDGGDELFTFENASSAEFPQRIIYRHGAGDTLYAHVAGRVNGAAQEVIYPMHHVDCQTGEPRRK